MILNNFEVDSNFWKINPQLKIPEVFAKLYDSDKSKNKDESSKLMWAIALILDTESKFNNLSLDERKNLVAKDFLKNVKFNWKSLNDQMKLYTDLMTSPAQRQLQEWNRLMDEKSIYVRTLKYNATTADEIEKRLLSNGKLYEELNRLSKMLEKEGSTGVVKGGSEESLSEKGEI